jgi:hypothetical protein
MFDLLEWTHALALEMASAGDGVHRRRREAVLNLQPVPHHTPEQFALRVRHQTKLPFTTPARNAQLITFQLSVFVLPFVSFVTLLLIRSGFEFQRVSISVFHHLRSLVVNPVPFRFQLSAFNFQFFITFVPLLLCC